jgi:SAM-dependent methyltransferase
MGANDEEENFYGPHYARIDGELAAEIRREVFGQDIGQESWRSAAEHAELTKLLNLTFESRALDVACGGGGPSLALAEHAGCRIVGIDIEPKGVAHANALAARRNLADRATFAVQDCNLRLPFDDASFDAVLCIDSIGHLDDRVAVVADWARLLREGSRLVFTDPLVVTGALAKREIDGRTALGSHAFFVPPGFNEDAIRAAGLALVARKDCAAAQADVASRWHDARLRRETKLRRDEGDWFERRQLMLKTTAVLAASRRLSRFLYVAEKA